MAQRKPVVKKTTTTRKPRSKSAILKPVANGSAPEIIATLSPDHLIALRRAHDLVADAKFKVDVANHFLNKVNEEIQEQYDLPTAFTINVQDGTVTEGA
jgi:hypothetical protein